MYFFKPHSSDLFHEVFLFLFKFNFVLKTKVNIFCILFVTICIYSGNHSKDK